MVNKDYQSILLFKLQQYPSHAQSTN